ncbi:MAG TPA: hypothetical protein VEN81_02235 [Planctomycetota bacterium]|nr:hypothetical protein [Planctomycetota bacterium]
MASGKGVSPKGKRQRGAVLIEYIILAAAVLTVGFASVTTYYTDIQTEFGKLGASVLGLF